MNHESASSENQPGRATRRRLLGLSAGVFATGLAGCTGGPAGRPDATPPDTSTGTATDTPVTTEAPSRRHEQADDPFRELNRTETTSTTAVSFEVVLEAGQYAHRELRIEAPSELEITGESTARMDVFLLRSESVFASYQSGEQPLPTGALTATDIDTIDSSIEVSPGTYFLVFDNTATYGVAPQGDLNSRFEVTVSSGQPTPTGTTNPPGENNAEIVGESEMPKIRSVTDNFGHTFVWDAADGGEASHTVSVEDELVVSDDTTVSLTVDEVWADAGDDLSFSYVFGSSRRSHPDNTAFDEKVRSNTHTWQMSREQYSSAWRFQIYLRNEDGIYYHNEASESDFKFTVYYGNLTLA